MNNEERGEVVLVGEFVVSETDEKVLSAKYVGLAVDDRLLLQDAQFTLLRGHRYGLIGENGTGKTTLLQAIRAQLRQEEHTNFCVRYVGQTDAEGSAEVKESVIEYCSNADSKRSALTRELEELESPDLDEEDIAAAAERIGEIMMELEIPDDSKERADALLRKLGFVKAMRDGPVASLSGGWRARLEMACAVFAEPDILFLDEPTNHLDLHAVFQLAALLRHNEKMTVIVVSHDASFLDLVSTDILSINGCMLQSINGNYSAFEEKAAEYKRFHEHIYDNRVREEARQTASTNQLRNNARKSGNDKALKQAASRDRKASARVGLYREDGKKFKLNSLKTLDTASLRLPSRAAPVKRQPVTKITLPQSHRVGGGAGNTVLVELRTATVRYPNTQKDLLVNVDLQICAGDRVALVGKNGAGKSTLLRTLAGNAHPAKVVSGEVRHIGRTAIVDQNQLALLEGHLEKTCVQFLRERHAEFFKSGDDTNVRKHLGQFGLQGDSALLPIVALSGGLRVRLVLADLFADDSPPDVLLLDEPTNHLDGETIAALTAALKTFSGAVLAISHNCAFLLEVCRDLWICDKGVVTTQKQVEGSPFLENFRSYAEKIVPPTEKEALQDMLVIRAARSAIVVQQPGASTSLLV
ncbi:hypothetical protein SAMD00019534_028790 [Acytostelium subglobosum LB1]|uniref:hypothetical protein n=1 Tax=Acytostelium subglobosum LB1 TaxID=1410327 RepID=UPI000644A33F|nr:hypothetical protein SAMD00019534_028790 [Acytostelium subglobosum LB1]GAM19704.1 hypothetical protein SAMD00019534_028790 [Acytostelium subglobosum LB1]|eukprot:XP_012756466.1 hypothetical protein SAMD00019534_028790 [Acytostelium subglobosum LB1]